MRTSAVDIFIPEVWSARLRAHLDKLHVYASLFNHDYEGEISAFGDTVHINQIGNITIKDYDGGDIDAPEELSGNQKTLAIDKAKYFNFQVKDIDNVQTNPKLMDSAMQRASYEVNDVIDQVCANILVDGVDADNILTISDTLSPANAYNYLVDLGTVLSEANVPTDGRWVVVPPWFHALLLKDQRFISYGKGVNDNVLGNGKVGEVSGFIVHQSNNVPHVYTKAGSFSSGTDYYVLEGGVYTKVKEPTSADVSKYYTVNQKAYQIIGGTNQAGTFAEQLVELEAYRLEKNFSDGVKGLQVFGAKVIESKCIAMMTAVRA